MEDLLSTGTDEVADPLEDDEDDEAENDEEEFYEPGLSIEDETDVNDDLDLSRTLIRGCVAVATMLIRSPAITRPVNSKWVQRCFWDDKCDAIDIEKYKLIAKIVNLLRPLYPQDIQAGTPSRRHILLALPIVTLANFVLDSLGYHVFF